MSKYIATSLDEYDNKIYLVDVTKDSVESSTDFNKARLFSADEKKEAIKLLKKQFKRYEFIKLEKVAYLIKGVHSLLNDYICDFFIDIPKFLKRKSNDWIEAIGLAKSEELNDIQTMLEFSEKVSERLLEKYNYPKKDWPNS